MNAGYSGTPLPKKLGIREKTRVVLLGAPDGFMSELGELAPGVTVRNRAVGPADVVILFAMRFSRLKKEFEKAMGLLPADGGMLWVSWPKKAAKMDTDLDENIVRDHGLARGMVDTKVCAIDETWSGLRFSRRRGVR